MKFSEFTALVDDLVTPFGLARLPRQFNRPEEQAGWQAGDIHVRLYFHPQDAKPVLLGFSRIAGTLVIADKERPGFPLDRDGARAVAHAIFQRLAQRVKT